MRTVQNFYRKITKFFKCAKYNLQLETSLPPYDPFVTLKFMLSPKFFLAVRVSGNQWRTGVSGSSKLLTLGCPSAVQTSEPRSVYLTPCSILYFIEQRLGELECVGHSFTYAAHFVFLKDVWI